MDVGWQTDRMGFIHDKQSARHTSSFQLGHDMRLCSIWKLRRLWRLGQYLLNIQVCLHLLFIIVGGIISHQEMFSIFHSQPENTRRQRSSQPGIAGTHGLSELLPFPGR